MSYWHPQRYKADVVYPGDQPPIAATVWLELPWHTFRPFLVPRYVEQDQKLVFTWPEKWRVTGVKVI